MKFLTICAVAGAMLLCGRLAADGSTLWHSTDAIAAAAEQRVMNDRGKASRDLQAHADPVDATLRVAQCGKPLTTRYVGAPGGPRTTIGVACPGPSRWQVYVSVRTVAWQSVVVAAAHLPRGHVLTAEDLTTLRSDVSAMSLGYFSDADALIGRTLTRSVARGNTITPPTVSARKDVRKGQTVALIAAISGAQIKMSGEALADGAIGDRVQVRNLSSGRTVEGVIQAGGSVLIAP